MAGDSCDATIVVTSMNRALRKLCQLFIPRDFPVFVVDGARGCWGIRAIEYVIDNAPCDRAVLLDEDAFIMDADRLRRLVSWSGRTRTACVGMCDGGVVPIRTYNPNALNPFFNILDLRQIRQQWDANECRSFTGAARNVLELRAPEHVLTPGVSYRFDEFEPYYCFYFWLHAKAFPINWLRAETHRDGISTLLHDMEGEPFLLHTWYGRTFGREPRHTARIVSAAQWVARRNCRSIVNCLHHS